MINTEESILALIDVQSRLIDVIHRQELVLPNTLKLIQGCQALGIPILASVQVPEKLGPMPAEIVQALGDVNPIPKVVFSALREPDFLLALRQSGRKQVILAGIEAHVCVLQTGLDLLDAGFVVHVLSDAVFSRAAENHQVALERLHDAGAVVSSVEIVLFEMLRSSEHPKFRTISKIIK